MRGYFVTGTDTDVGKTSISLALVHKLRQQGERVGVMKPIAAGGNPTPEGLRNNDAIQLQQQSNVQLDYNTINPYAFASAIAPHIAAEDEGIRVDIETLFQHYQTIAAQSDCVVVEGAGGWQVPLNDFQTIADLAKRLQLPVVLVVGMRLGCINHALLTVESINRSGLPLAGWIANQMQPQMNRVEENIAALRQRIEAPLLGYVPYFENYDITTVAQCLTLPPTRYGLRPHWTL